MRSRSTLEHAVLGIVWKHGPVTPYAIRREFITSPTPHFSGSAGAIYPLVNRLEDDGLLASSEAQQGQRRSRVYRITRTGLAEFRRWLRPPVPADDTAATFDPLRTRLYFLAALTAPQRNAFIEAALDGLHAQIAVTKADEQRYAEAGDLFSQLASMGIRMSIENRIAWLKAVRSEMKKQHMLG